MRIPALLLTLLLQTSIAPAAERTATVSGGDSRIAIRNSGDHILLDAAETAKAFNWRLKVVTPGNLITFCRDSGCIPVRLTKIKFQSVKDQLFVDAPVLAKALGFSIQKKGGNISLSKLAIKKDSSDKIPAYNAKWGKGRGFDVGQTLPDIPLVDLKGNEVRFSKYLGRQYIIYCWASW